MIGQGIYRVENLGWVGGRFPHVQLTATSSTFAGSVERVFVPVTVQESL